VGRVSRTLDFLQLHGTFRIRGFPPGDLSSRFRASHGWLVGSFPGRALVAAYGELGSEVLLERILSEIQGFAGADPQDDDMTILLLKVTGDSPS
jgi:hypothetical protein